MYTKREDSLEPMHLHSPISVFVVTRDQMKSVLEILKDGLPYLFHSFRNKYFNKISLGTLLYFQKNCKSFEKIHGFPINMQ